MLERGRAEGAKQPEQALLIIGIPLLR